MIRKLFIKDKGLGKVEIKLDGKKVDISGCNGYELKRTAGEIAILKLSYLVKDIEIKINSD